MKTRNHIIRSLALAAALLAVSCADATSTDSATMTSTQQAVEVMPEFHIQGTDQLPEQFQLTDLGLVFSEIRLEPVDDSDNGLAYSNRDPIEMTFDVEGGETAKLGQSFVLPEAGTYDVSLRLEPASRRHGRMKNSNYSFDLTGYIRGDAVVHVDPRNQDPNSDGDPVPLPFNPSEAESDDDQLHDRMAAPKQWTRFQYQSKKSLVYTLDEVEFEQGRQYLSFVFDVEDWGEELIKPISRVVRHRSGDAPGSLDNEGQRPVDVTSALDSLGEGPASLEDHVRVRTMSPSAHERRPGPGGL